MSKATTVLGVLLVVAAGVLISSCQKEKVQHAEDRKSEQKPTRQQGEVATVNTSVEGTYSNLTERDQKEFERIYGGGIPSPSLFKNQKDAVNYLEILLKGNEKTIRWYVNTKEDALGRPVDREKEMPLVYANDICTAVKALALKNESAFELIVEVMKTKSFYPAAYACACETMGWYAVKEGRDRVKQAIPLLEEALKHKNIKVRVEAAGALLASGKADTALPVLDESAKLGDVRSLLLLYEPEDHATGAYQFTKLWDNRGLDILRKAMEYPNDEVKAYAANALTILGREKERSEEVALTIVKKLMRKTDKDYGYRTIDTPKGPTKVLLPGFEGKDVQELDEKKIHDRRACYFAMYALGRLKSKKAIPLLQSIKEQNTDYWNVCWEHKDGPAENALVQILGNGDGK